jgi:ribonuclease HI
MNLILSFDGACEPPPGGVATFSWAIEEVRGGKPYRVEDGTGMAKAESGPAAAYHGLGHGLCAVRKLKPESLEIRGDSQAVINQLTGAWACHPPYLAKLRDRCLELLKEMGCPWSARWVRP